jgi:UTP:GlnB (protein PII) uridylyltransferase
MTIPLELPEERALLAELQSRAAATVVRFLEDSGGTFSVLEVETTDRSGFVLVLSHALFGQGVEIVGAEVHTRGPRVLDRFKISERQGRPISEARRLDVQVAVLGAVDSMGTMRAAPFTGSWRSGSPC